MYRQCYGIISVLNLVQRDIRERHGVFNKLYIYFNINLNFRRELFTAGYFRC